MKEFEHLMSVWQTQPKPDKLSVDHVLKQVKKGVGGISRKLLWNIVSMTISSVFILYLFLFFPFAYWTTYSGILIILSSVVVYTYVMVRDYRLLHKHDATLSPAEYLQSLKEYQRNRAKMFGWMYYVYMLLLSIGLSLYLIEVLNATEPVNRWIACIAIIAWLLFVTFYLKDRIFKNEQGKLNLMIDRLERLQNQFE